MSDDLRLVIFDLDGVLIDSEILGAKIIIETVAEMGIAIDLLYVRRNFMGKNFQAVMANLESSFKVILPSDFERTFLDRLAISFEENLKATEGIGSVLADLRAASCIATSSPPERAMNSLRICGLSAFFTDAVFTSSMVEHAKPAPDLFLLAAKKMGVDPSQCLVVEDSVAGFHAGLSAGMTTSRYVGGSHLQGRDLVRPPPKGLDMTFDNWANFSSIYPSLFIGNERHGQ